MNFKVKSSFFLLPFLFLIIGCGMGGGIYDLTHSSQGDLMGGGDHPARQSAIFSSVGNSNEDGVATFQFMVRGEEDSILFNFFVLFDVMTGMVIKVENSDFESFSFKATRTNFDGYCVSDFWGSGYFFGTVGRNGTEIFGMATFSKDNEPPNSYQFFAIRTDI